MSMQRLRWQAWRLALGSSAEESRCVVINQPSMGGTAVGVKGHTPICCKPSGLRRLHQVFVATL